MLTHKQIQFWAGNFQEHSPDSFKEKFTTSFLFGLELNIKRIIISARYERGFTDNEVLIIDSKGNIGPGHVHIRPKQYILSLLYSLAL